MTEAMSPVELGSEEAPAWVPEMSHLPLRDQAYEAIRAAILRRDFRPGERLDLEQLESAMGISRTPLKEALQRLASDRLVEVVARRGTYVSKLDVGAVVDLFALRQILEAGAVPWIIANASDDDIEHVAFLNEELLDLIDSGPFEDVVVEYIERDRAFHTALMTLAENRSLLEAHANVNTHLQIARVSTSFVREQSEATAEEHRRIVDALRLRSELDLRDAICDHVVISRERTVVAMHGAS